MGIDISVIIINYNNFDLLENCLLSLFNNNYGVSFEVIVVDNASTIGNIESVSDKFPTVTFLKNSVNKGFAAANNQGSNIAAGKYLLFLNNDTVFLENSLKKIYDFSESKNEEVIVGCKLLNSDFTLQESVVNFTTVWTSITENFFLYKLFPKSSLFSKYHLNYKNLAQISEVDFVKGAFLFCSKDSFRALNGFDERFYFYAEENDFCYRFKKQIGKVYYYPLTSIIHIGGASTDKDLWFKFKNQTIASIQIYQKHFNGISFFLCMLSHYSGLLLRTIFYFLGGIFFPKKHLFTKSKYYLLLLFIYPKNEFKTHD